MPAVLTELAFIDNGIDYSKLSTENGDRLQQKPFTRDFRLL